MSKRKRRRPNATGRSQQNHPQFLQLPYEMLQHKKFKNLSGSAIKVLLEISIRHSGFNNRKITCSYSELEKPLKLGRATVSRALKELMETGFIVLVRKGYFTGRRASVWEITFIRSEGYEPTHMWKDPAQRPHRPYLEPIKRNVIEETFSDLVTK